MSILQDPKLFNYVLFALHLGAAARWAIAMNGPQVLYWLGAAYITAVMTWAFDR